MNSSSTGAQRRREQTGAAYGGDAENSVNGRLEAIWLKRAHRGKMDEVTAATVVAGRGLEGSVDRSRRRQVTIIEREMWEALTRELDADIPASSRRANLMVSGIRLEETRGRTLRMGDVRLAIGGEVTPCERMDEGFLGLRAAMLPNWRGGVFAQVLDDGIIRVGDVVRWESNETDRVDT